MYRISHDCDGNYPTDCVFSFPNPTHNELDKNHTPLQTMRYSFYNIILPRILLKGLEHDLS